MLEAVEEEVPQLLPPRRARGGKKGPLLAVGAHLLDRDLVEHLDLEVSDDCR